MHARMARIAGGGLHTLPQVTQTCGRVKWQGRGHSSESAVTPTVNSYDFRNVGKVIDIVI